MGSTSGPYTSPGPTTGPYARPDLAEEEPNFEGIAGSPCEHRTVGPHRAWCHTCGEWCYPSDPCDHCYAALPVDWPARFRAAADVIGHGRVARDLSLTAAWLEKQPPHVVEAIGRALLGEGSA